jgi:hypothetical protein
VEDLDAAERLADRPRLQAEGLVGFDHSSASHRLGG